MDTAVPEEITPENNDLTTVRDLILRAHPDVVPELVTGGTIAELTASVEPARAAYGRIVEAARRQDGGGGENNAEHRPPTVPAGGAPMVVDLDRLPTAELLRRGIAQRSR